jgi:hypothetical protein
MDYDVRLEDLHVRRPWRLGSFILPYTSMTVQGQGDIRMCNLEDAKQCKASMIDIDNDIDQRSSDIQAFY